MTRFTGLNGPLPASKPEGESKPLVEGVIFHPVTKRGTASLPTVETGGLCCIVLTDEGPSSPEGTRRHSPPTSSGGRSGIHDRVINHTPSSMFPCRTSRSALSRTSTSARSLPDLPWEEVVGKREIQRCDSFRSSPPCFF